MSIFQPKGVSLVEKLVAWVTWDAHKDLVIHTLPQLVNWMVVKPVRIKSHQLFHFSNQFFESENEKWVAV